MPLSRKHFRRSRDAPGLLKLAQPASLPIRQIQLYRCSAAPKASAILFLRLLLLLCRLLRRRFLDCARNLLHALELPGLIGVALVRHFGDFLLNGRLPIAGVWMIGEELWTPRAAIRFQLLKELRHL